MEIGFSALHPLGWSSAWQHEFETWIQRTAQRRDLDANGSEARPASAAGLSPARVSREDKGSYLVLSAHGELRAAVSGAFRHAAAGRADFPAVGDWVVIAPRHGEAAATIHGLLQRRSAVCRKVAGDAAAEQIVAANVDTLLICTGLDHDFNVRRIERYLTLAWESGAAPVLVLSKADVCDDIAARLIEVDAVAGGVPLHVACAIRGEGVEELRGYLMTAECRKGFPREEVREGILAPANHAPIIHAPAVRASLTHAVRTVALVGSSGAGKSTLINALLGENRQKTAAVREHDGRGRHTTTHRELVAVPGGGVIIDTPGMRELQLWGDESALAGAFGDIDALAAECRFRDCGHESEPGCRVRSAIESGELPAARYESFLKLRRELRYLEMREDPEARRAEVDRWKVIHKAARRHMKRKYGD